MSFWSALFFTYLLNPMRRSLFLCLSLLMAFSAFAQNGNAGVAILPINISILPQQDTPDDIKEYSKKIGVFFQQAMYGSLREGGGDVLQPPAKTNAILTDAGLDLDAVYWLDKTGLCNLLKVKYVIVAQIQFGKGVDKAKADGGEGWYKLANDPDKMRIFRLEVFSMTGQSAWDYKENFSWNQMIMPNSAMLQPNFYAAVKKQIEGFLQ